MPQKNEKKSLEFFTPDLYFQYPLLLVGTGDAIFACTHLFPGRVNDACYAIDV